MKQARQDEDVTKPSKAATPPPGVYAEPAWPAMKSDQPHKSSVVGPPPVWTRYIDSRLKQFSAR